MATQANQIAWNTNSPSGLGDTNFWQYGDVVFNNGAAVANTTAPLGWYCQAAGYPGTWAPITVEPVSTLVTTATSGTLTNGQRLTLLNPASTGTYSLPSAAANMAGAALTFKSLASGSITLTPIAANNYADAAAITLAQFASITLLSNASTTWYKQS